MPRTKQTVMNKFNVLLIEANAAEIAEMKQALYWHGVFMGAPPKTASNAATEPKARKKKPADGAFRLDQATDPAAKG